MKLSEHFPTGGKGVLATSSGAGTLNTAVYAVPHVVDEETIAWGMTEGRSHRNVLENPNASFIYFEPGDVLHGVRLTLRLDGVNEMGRLLEEIKERARETVSPRAASAVKYVAYFKVVEIRPLY